LKEDQKIKNSKNHINSVIGAICDRFFVSAQVIVAVISLIACDGRKELLEQDVFDGPMMEMDNINTMMTDSGKLVMRLIAPKQLLYENNDKEWPKGLILEYYQENSKPICTFQSNTAYFDAEENLYRGEGNVVVRNLDTGDELTTEILFWSPAEGKFYTNNFVTIVSDGEIHTGEGLSANQDFSSYQILKPSGTIQIEEEF
jgi:LPS export ABC transporter protein LptC